MIDSSYQLRYDSLLRGRNEMTVIALFGAGGKMGYRLSSNLKGSLFEGRHVEVSDERRERLMSALGTHCLPPDASLPGAQAANLSRPDPLIVKLPPRMPTRPKSDPMA